MAKGKSFDIFGAISKGLSKGKNKLVEALGGMFDGVKTSLEKIVKGWIDWQNTAFATARTIGLTREQAQGLQDVLMKDQVELSRLYGLTGKEVNDFQRGIVTNTGRAIILTKQQTESLAALHNLVNDGGSGGTENMLQLVGAFQEFGISIDDTMIHVAMLQEKAAEYGMSAQAASAELAKNIRLAQSYTFKHGVDGLAAMVLKAKQLRVDIQSIVAASDKFSNIEDSIKNAAGVQMLGGTFAANFANPMAVMADALMNQEAFGDRIIGALEGKGTWNEKTGQVDISAVDRAMIKQFANTVGLKFEDAMKMAQSSAQNAAIDRRLSMNANQFNDAQQQWIRSNAQWSAEKKTFVVAGIDENGNRVESEVENLTPQMLDSMRSSALTEENMMANVSEINDNVRDLARKTGLTKAQRLVSAQQNASGMVNAFTTSAARMVTPVGNRISNVINGNSKTGQNLDKIAGNPYYAAVAGMGVDAVKSLYKGLTGKGGLSGAFGKAALAIGGVSAGAILAGKSLGDLSNAAKSIGKDLLYDMKTPVSTSDYVENVGASRTNAENSRNTGHTVTSAATTSKESSSGSNQSSRRGQGNNRNSGSSARGNNSPSTPTSATSTPATTVATPTKPTQTGNSSGTRIVVTNTPPAEQNVAEARIEENPSPEPIQQTAYEVLNNNFENGNVAIYSYENQPTENPSVAGKSLTGGTVTVSESQTNNYATLTSWGGGYSNGGPIGNKQIDININFGGTSTLDFAGISKTDMREVLQNSDNENTLLKMIRSVVNEEIREFAYKTNNYNSNGMLTGGSITEGKAVYEA